MVAPPGVPVETNLPDSIITVLPAAFVLATSAYIWLAATVSRQTSQHESRTVSYFLLLIAAMIAGSALSYNTTNPQVHAIGRVLGFFAAGFLPVVMYVIYREYAVSVVNRLVVGGLLIIPIATLLLVITNDLHHIIWSQIETDNGYAFSPLRESKWYQQVFAPYAFGVFGYSILALAARMPSIATAHRRKIGLLIFCALVPYTASVLNNLFGLGSAQFPFTSTVLVIMLPLYWYTALSMRVFEFSPLAYQTMFDHVRDPIIVLDRSQRIVSANRPAQGLLGATESELIGRDFWQDVPELKAHGKQVVENDLSRTVRFSSNREYELNSAPLVGANGTVQGTVVVCRDVTERKRALRALADSEHLIRSLVEHSSNGILRFARNAVDPVGPYHCTFANSAAARFLGADANDLVSAPIENLQVLQPERLIENFDSPGVQSTSISYEIERPGQNGSNWLRIIAEAVGSDFSVTLIDITQRKHNENKIMQDALRDPLTGVLNRRGFEKYGNHAVESNSTAAVLYIDLDQFKAINDRHGHDVGDALLKAFGHRIEFCLRSDDVLARLGGDEFVIVLAGVCAAEAERISKRLVDASAEAYIIKGNKIRCAASVGTALMPEQGDELWHLVSVADQAMYESKKFGRDGEPVSPTAATA